MKNGDLYYDGSKYYLVVGCLPQLDTRFPVDFKAASKYSKTGYEKVIRIVTLVLNGRTIKKYLKSATVQIEKSVCYETRDYVKSISLEDSDILKLKLLNVLPAQIEDFSTFHKEVDELMKGYLKNAFEYLKQFRIGQVIKYNGIDEKINEIKILDLDKKSHFTVEFESFMYLAEPTKEFVYIKGV